MGVWELIMVVSKGGTDWVWFVSHRCSMWLECEWWIWCFRWLMNEIVWCIGCIWMCLNVFEFVWICLNESEWNWMNRMVYIRTYVDECGWMWMYVDLFGLVVRCPTIAQLVERRTVDCGCVQWSLGRWFESASSEQILRFPFSPLNSQSSILNSHFNRHNSPDQQTQIAIPNSTTPSLTQSPYQQTTYQHTLTQFHSHINTYTQTYTHTHKHTNANTDTIIHTNIHIHTRTN